MDAQVLKNQDFWMAICPELHIGDAQFCEGVQPFALDPSRSRDLAILLRQEGYFQEHFDWNLDLLLMANAVRKLSLLQLSPVFAFLYDEYWLMFHKLHRFYQGLLGEDYFLLPDFWVWDIDPKKNEAGWKPHRDKGRKSLFADGSPKSLTTWVPLSEATPLNSCIYIVPAGRDPTYGTLEEATPLFAYPDIRALPGKPGDVFFWNQAVMHWGSNTSPRAPETRVSMAFEFQRADVPAFNTPLIRPLVTMRFEDRLKLVAKQILQYRHMYQISAPIEAVAREIIA